MSKVYIPDGYKSPLSVYEMQRAIEFIKSNFQTNLCNALNLRRVSAPLFVDEESGLNDNLNGVERPVSFDIPDAGIADAQVVHSLAKWKRLALKRYHFNVGKGLVTDMDAIRRDEELDNIHSVYVDQWDWEKVISREDRNVPYLKQVVRAIVGAVCETNDALCIAFPSLHTQIERDVYFVTTQELEDRYPDLTPRQREDAICREHRTVFLMQIGGALKGSGKPHDGRAPDYDDWQLNGDILIWNDVLSRAFEISSMGIRVDEESMARQLEIRQCTERAKLPFHKMLLSGQLPLTVGGGIGQSRLCMLLIGACHIGEVQCSLWDHATQEACEKAGILLL
ncbi:MAG: aspartate--ammonia ligase [Oscillospiraceae bacterium]|nr:aspartate--ammonia ligase [Oscillospiraceae bacterium]